MLWGKFSKNLVFLSKSCFSIISIDPIYFSINRNFVLKFMGASALFDWSNLFFDQSKIVFQVFLKQFFDYFKNILFKKFFNFSSLSDLATILYNFFVVFFLNFCKVFLPQGRYDYSNPPFCFIFCSYSVFPEGFDMTGPNNWNCKAWTMKWGYKCTSDIMLTFYPANFVDWLNYESQCLNIKSYNVKQVWTYFNKCIITSFNISTTTYIHKPIWKEMGWKEERFR